MSAKCRKIAISGDREGAGRQSSKPGNGRFFSTPEDKLVLLQVDVGIPEGRQRPVPKVWQRSRPGPKCTKGWLN